MYLGELGITSDPARASSIAASNAALLKQNERERLATECMRAGGSYQYDRAAVGYVCKYPQAAPASSAPVTVTVSPQIQTQVSPQISPAFQQQFQPSGSPMTAGTSQTSAQPVGITGSSAPAQLPPAPAPAPAAAPAYSAPPPAQAQQLPPAPAPSQGGGGSVNPPDMAPAPVPVPAPVQAPVAAGFDWKIAAIIGAAMFGAMAVQKRK